MRRRGQSMMVEKRATPHRREFVFIVPERRSPMMNHIMRFVRDEEGATALEYGLLAALIAAAIIGAVTQLGQGITATFTNVAGQLGGSGGLGSGSGS